MYFMYFICENLSSYDISAYVQDRIYFNKAFPTFAFLLRYVGFSI